MRNFRVLHGDTFAADCPTCGVTFIGSDLLLKHDCRAYVQRVIADARRRERRAWWVRRALAFVAVWLGFAIGWWLR